MRYVARPPRRLSTTLNIAIIGPSAMKSRKVALPSNANITTPMKTGTTDAASGSRAFSARFGAAGNANVGGSYGCATRGGRLKSSRPSRYRCVPEGPGLERCTHSSVSPISTT